MNGLNMTDTVEKACPECPFRRGSAPGYLGAASGDPQGFLNPHWNAGVPLPCHMQVDWEAEQTRAEIEAKPLCRGLLTMMKNAAKLPESARVRLARDRVEADRETFFSFPHEFHQHHVWRGPGERPHSYSPDYMAMGDCRVCGHTREAHE